MQIEKQPHLPIAESLSKRRRQADIDKLAASAVRDEYRRRRVSTERGFEGAGKEVSTVVGEHRSERHGARALKPDDSRGAICVHGTEAEVFSHRFEFREVSGARDAEWANSGKDSQPVTVDGDGHLADRHYEAGRDQEARPDQERETEEGHRQVEVPLDDLRAVDAEHGSTGPRAGEWHEKQSGPASSTGSGGETVSFRSVPGAGGRRIEIDWAGGRNHGVDERSENAAGAP